MHDIPHIVSAAMRSPWAATREHVANIRDFLYKRALGMDLSAARAELEKQAEDRPRFQRRGSVAVIPVFGTISHKMNLLSAYSGGTSTELLEKEIRAAVADEDISAIVLNVDSPGGSVYGLPEIHEAIMDLRGKKNLVASVNPLSASAAYWITSAASEISVTPSGEAGSIGVYAMHVDESEFDKKMGMTMTLIDAPEGGRKVEGHPFAPLSEEARANIQKDIDAYYQMFVRDVAKGRKVSVSDVRSKFGEGGMMLAKDAKAAGLVDRIETLDETIARLSRAHTTKTRRAAIGKQLDMAGRFIG